MKIATLTFQFSINFGAQLQCLALQEVLKEMGHDVEVLQYNPDFTGKKAPFYRNVGIKQNGLSFALKHAFVKLVYASKMANRFNKFQKKHLNLTEPCDLNTIGKISQRYNAIVVGSDQVWGPAHHENATYFIGWKPEFKGKRISYAPCCAINKTDAKYKANIANLLNQFDFLSVRNLETQDFVDELTGLNTPVVLDPTLLVDFPQFLHSFKVPYKKYILAYIIGNEIKGGHENMIREIKKVRGNIPVIAVILSENHIKFFPWADKTYWSLTPDEWVSLIASADFFYTDSFHGVVFGVKSNVSLLAYYVDEKRKSRFVDLSVRFNLKSNIVNSVSDALARNCINRGTPDYELTHKIIREERITSKAFLKNALGTENHELKIV